MERGGIGGVLENRGREKNFRADSGASGAGIDFQRATELGHAFAHPGNSDAESRLAPMGSAVGGDDHAAPEVCDFEDDALSIFAEHDVGTLAAGVALDVGEAFLSDAK